MNFIFHRRRWKRAVRLLLAGLAVLGFCVCAPAQERPTEYQVKAAFLEKFGKFVEWPDTAFAGAGSPLVIGVFGENPFRDDLENLAAKDTINGHAIVVRQIKSPADLKGCHVVFISALVKAREPEALAAVNGLGILTVGETDNFIQAGGMINFVIDNSRIRFEINDAAARRAGLKISSKLLALARPAAAKPPG
jgi:hypothetical protein